VKIGSKYRFGAWRYKGAVRVGLANTCGWFVGLEIDRHCGRVFSVAIGVFL